MPRDLNDLLAEGAPRDPGQLDLDAIEARAARRRTGRIGATVAAVLAAVAIGVQTWPSTPEVPIIDEVEDGVVQDDGTTVLPLPEPGEVLPAHANGRPVFVVHAQDGDVRVLDALSPHDPYPEAMKVLAYCTTSGWFEDPWHGSAFSDNGAWVGGPAPYGLATHEVVEVGADTLTVGTLRSAPARGVLQGTEPTGAACHDDGVDGGTDLEALVIHTDVTDVRVAGLLYPERPDDDCCGLLLPEDPQVPVAGEPVTVVLPTADEIVARHVGDRPAFLVPRAGEDGVVRVTVLDGINPHVQFGPTALTVCTEATVYGSAGRIPDSWGVVYDPWYLSEFSPVGRIVEVDGVQRSVPAGGWTGGPAPTGLSRFPVLEVRETGSAVEVTVASGVLPPLPRVDLGWDDADVQEQLTIDGDLPTEGCSGRDQLFPDMPPADPTLLDDLVLHEPLHPDLWWYPTPARLLGDEPGLPPEELERYLDEVADDRVLLDLDALPLLGDAGFALQTEAGVELADLDGTTLGLVLGAELVVDGRDGHGGAFLLRDADGTERWVAPSNGTTMPAEGVTLAGDYVEQADGSWQSDGDFPPPLEGPLRVANRGALVTGPRCEGRDCPAPTIVDLDMGGVGVSEPGCVATDKFGDFNSLEVCFRTDTSEPAVVGRFVDGDRQWPVPRYEGQPADIPTIGHFRDALFGPLGVVAQLSLECEVPAVVLLRDDGTVEDPWGAASWEGGPTSTLLGSTVALGPGGAVPLAQVAAGSCGDAQGVDEGIWALTADGPQLLNAITDPVVYWDRFTADLDEVARAQARRRDVAATCAEPDAAEQATASIDDVDLDGDGQLDRVLLGAGVTACLADGGQSRYETPPVEFATVADLGTGADVLAVGGTLVSSSVAELLLWMNDRLTPVVLGCTEAVCVLPDEPQAAGFEDGFIGGGQGSATWGCRAVGDDVAFLTVRAVAEDGEVTVTTVEYELRGATLDEVDRTVTTRADDGSGFVALDHLRDLGATRYCER